MNRIKILFDLTEKDTDLSTDFLNAMQKDNNKSQKEFWVLMCEIWQYFSDKFNNVEKPFQLHGFEATTVQLSIAALPLKGNINLFNANGLTKEAIRITFNALLNYGIEHKLIRYYYAYKGLDIPIKYTASPKKLFTVQKNLNQSSFKAELKNKEPNQIETFLDYHLRIFVRNGGDKQEWVEHTKSILPQLSIEQTDSFYSWVEAKSIELSPKKTEIKLKQEQPKTFEELFFNPLHAEPCLRILAELQPPVIDAANNFIGNAKGIFPLWVKVLKNHKPQPLIKHFKDTVYKDLLNLKVKGLNLTKDASEFRKQYKRLNSANTELDIKTILSQYSQSGKLGK